MRTALELAARQAALLTGEEAAPALLPDQAVAASPVIASPAAGSGGDLVTATLIANPIDVPPDAFAGLFRVAYAPGATEESQAQAGPMLNVVTAGTLSVALHGPALVTRTGSPGSGEAVDAGTEVELEVGDGLVIAAGTATTIRNAGEIPAVLLLVVVLPFGPPPPPVEGVHLRTLGFGLPPAAGDNAVVLEQVTVEPEAELASPALIAVAGGHPELTEQGGLYNSGVVPAEVLVVTDDVAEAPPPEAGPPPPSPPET